MMRALVLTAVLALDCIVSFAGDVIYTQRPDMGVNALPAERNRWRSKSLRAAEATDRMVAVPAATASRPPANRRR